MVVFEYLTTAQYDAVDRITGWQHWNTELYPEKLVFEKNQIPTDEMGGIGALFDEDGLPQFILSDTGVISKLSVKEAIKKTIYSVMKGRFERDYPLDRKMEINMIVVGESPSTHPEVVEFKRRKAEVDLLNV
jgi:hypothetical protein